MTLFFHRKTDVTIWMKVACWLLCLSTVGTFSVLQKDQVAQQAIKFYRSKGAAQRHSWVAGNCRHLVGLLRQKNVVVKKLAAAADAVGRDTALSEAERHFQVSVRRNKAKKHIVDQKEKKPILKLQTITHGPFAHYNSSRFI